MPTAPSAGASTDKPAIPPTKPGIFASNEKPRTKVLMTPSPAANLPKLAQLTDSINGVAIFIIPSSAIAATITTPKATNPGIKLCSNVLMLPRAPDNIVKEFVISPIPTPIIPIATTAIPIEIVALRKAS